MVPGHAPGRRSLNISWSERTRPSGIDALQRFVRALPAESGMAFVVVLHLAPDRESRLADVLQPCTDMTVEQAADGVEVRANRVYVIPPGHRLPLRAGRLRIRPTDDERDRVMAAVEEAIETRSPFQLEHRVVQADGTEGWVESRAVPMLDADGEIVEWFGTATEIPDRPDAD